MPRLVLIRHGQSQWNLENRFTGWTDVGLTPQGEQEAIGGAKLLTDAGFRFDECHTSLLKRAIETLWIVMREMDYHWLPVYRSWRLNERHYGDLQGLNKAETSQKFGEDQVFTWRRSYATPPPPLDKDDPRYPGFDPRYADLAAKDVPVAESLAMTVDRVMPYWNKVLAPQIAKGRRLLIAAHGNSLRALIKYLDAMDDEAITQLNIPTGIPLVYDLDDNLRPRSRQYLGDADAAAKAAEAVAQQSRA